MRLGIALELIIRVPGDDGFWKNMFPLVFALAVGEWVLLGWVWGV